MQLSPAEYHPGPGQAEFERDSGPAHFWHAVRQENKKGRKSGASRNHTADSFKQHHSGLAVQIAFRGPHRPGQLPLQRT